MGKDVLCWSSHDIALLAMQETEQRTWEFNIWDFVGFKREQQRGG